MTVLRSFLRFWYDFIIGDDWKIAAAVVVAVGLTITLLELEVASDAVICVVGALLVMASFTASLLSDVRSKR